MVKGLLKKVITKPITLIAKNDTMRTSVIYPVFLIWLQHKMLFFKMNNKTEKAIEAAYFILECSENYLNDPALGLEAREHLVGTIPQLRRLISQWQKELKD